MKTTICLILVLALFPLVGHADYFNGQDIVDLYDNKYPESNAVMRGYFAGVQDAYNGELFCVPPDVKLDEAAGIIITYVRDNPNLQQKTGKNLVVEALSNAFPCDSQPAPESKEM